MPIFKCEQCGCIENTACCRYWGRKMDNKPLICSECDPEIGKWHGLFEKRPADGMLIDQRGHLWNSKENIPPSVRIVGTVTPNSN